MAVNRADKYQRARAGTAAKSFSEWRYRPCVFISHQKEDTQACTEIADFFLENDIDVYFDAYDKNISQLALEGDPTKITKHIQDGINYSTHMLGVISPATVKSYWVPFEIGYGYDRIPLGVVTLKGVRDDMLPEYLKATNVIRGTDSLDAFIAKFLGRPRVSVKSFSRHPLDRVLDANR